MSSYKWNNAGGDGVTQIFVLQIGETLHFYNVSAATDALPLSRQKLAATVALSGFIPTGGSLPSTIECQYTDGNGYLFVFHPNLDPFYCTYNSGSIVATSIILKTRDNIGLLETIDDQFRPTTLDAIHKYNLYNQGWTNEAAWTASSATTFTPGLYGSPPQIETGLNCAFEVAAGITGVDPADPCHIVASFNGNVNYSGTVDS